MRDASRDPEITLHVIYLAGSVRALHLGALSLAHYSPFRLRLVSNACPQDEERFLASLADGHPRLDFVRLPQGSTPLSHGQALDYLQEREQSDFFGFVDSDIFAVGEFARAVDFAAAPLFSALPVTTAWTRRHERFQRAKNAVGSSFFSIYRNERLRALRRETGWGFQICRWKRLPEPLQRRLEAAGERRKKFDTGKILNTWLAMEGERVVWLDDRNLRHLGGYSHPTPPVPGPGSVADLPAWLVRKLRRYADDYKTGGVLLESKRFYRTVCSEHFARVFDALAAGEPAPVLPRLRNGTIRRKLRTTTEELYALHALLTPRPEYNRGPPAPEPAGTRGRADHAGPSRDAQRPS